MVVKDGKIASISVVSTGDDASYFDRAKSLLDKIVSTQSTNVDTVSGCTYSSAGLINAVRNALSKAAVSDKAKKSNKKTTTKSTKKTKKSKSSKNKKKKNYSSTTKVSKDKQGAFPYPDGTYYGTAEGFVGDIIVAVTIKNKTITKIAVVSQEDDEEYFDEAVAVVDRMIKAQSTKVDTVSGATYSSKGLINAVINALKEAKAAADKQKQTATQTKPGTPAQPADPTKATDPTKSTDPSDVTKPSGTEDPEKPGDDSSDDPTDPTQTQSQYNDGTYEVTVMCYCNDDEDFEDYELSADVTIQDGKITAIANIAGGEADPQNKTYVKRATKIVAKIVAAGTPDGIDTISGATCTSKSILQACREALAKAKK